MEFLAKRNWINIQIFIKQLIIIKYVFTKLKFGNLDLYQHENKLFGTETYNLCLVSDTFTAIIQCERKYFICKLRQAKRSIWIPCKSNVFFHAVFTNFVWLSFQPSLIYSNLTFQGINVLQNLWRRLMVTKVSNTWLVHNQPN